MAVQATRGRILEVAVQAFTTRWYEEVTLRGIAADAGTALQTVVNHFGTKEELFGAVTQSVGDSIDITRWAVEPGDEEGAISLLVDDYERTGEFTLRMLALEGRVTGVQASLERGRKGHELWVEHVFAAALDDLSGDTRQRRLAQLVAVTDIYTWKLLHHDKSLDRNQTITAIRELVSALADRQGGHQSG